MKKDHFFYMGEALAEAKLALSAGEVPVGAVIVKDGEIIGRGRNEKERRQNPMGHGEIAAIAAASEKLGQWRLDGCTLYATLEPCPMCAGAMLQSRISLLVFGAWDLRWGAAGSIVDILNPQLFNHRIEIISGIREAESQGLLEEFFHKIRQNGL